MTLSLVHTWMLFDNMLTSYFFREHPRIMNEQRIVPTQFKGEIQLFQKKTMKHLGKCLWIFSCENYCEFDLVNPSPIKWLLRMIFLKQFQEKFSFKNNRSYICINFFPQWMIFSLENRNFGWPKPSLLKPAFGVGI